jgi:multidrug efflux pump subunit AcrB
MMSLPNLSAIAVRERSVTLFFILLLVAGGTVAFLTLGRAEDPAFTVRVMVVSVRWPGATIDEMRDQVVDRIEKRIQEVEYLYRMESTIRPGAADIQVEFWDYVPSAKVPDLFYEVRKRMIDEASRLPRGVIGPIVNDDFSDVYFALFSLTADRFPQYLLAREAEAVRDRLQRVPGVRKAILLGERPQQFQIEFNIPRLTNLGISAPEIFEAIRANNELVPSGFVDLPGPRVFVRVQTGLGDPQQVAEVPIRVGPHLIRLGDVAEVQRGYEDPPQYLVRFEGQNTLLLGVVMQTGENGQVLGRRLAEFVAEERTRLPLGITLKFLTNQTEAINQAVDLFQVKFLVAVGVVVLVSALAIGWRAGLIVGIVVPITLGLTFMLMLATNINLDRITLGALIIALGLLVDDAIIAIEIMIVKMEEGWDRIRAAGYAWTATAAPMLFGTLVTAAGFVPIGFARSGVGEYAGNIFWVLAYALIVSWFVAIIFTPYLGTLMLKTPVHSTGASELYQTRAYRLLRWLITLSVRINKIVVLLTLAVLGLSIFGLVVIVQKQFFPSSDRPEVLINIYLPQGSSIETTDATARKLEAVLAKMPELQTYATFVGAGAPRFFISANPEQPNPAFAKILAIAQNDTARERVIAQLQERLQAGEFPEARIRVSRLLYGPSVIWPITFRVIGPNPVQLRAIAHQVRQVMAQDPNTIDPHLEWDERTPTLHLEIDPERLRQIGLTPRDTAQQLQFALDGVTVTEIRDNIRTVELRARGRRSDGYPTEIKTLEGQKIPIEHLGQITVGFEEPVQTRIDRELVLPVVADIEGAQPPDVTARLWEKLRPIREQLPDGYRMDIGGTVEQSEKANGSIQKLQPVMVGIMLILIMLQMRTFSGTFMVLATAPLGIIGAVASLLIFQQPFGFVALLGLIGLAGILMRNTMILTQQVQDNIDDGMSRREAVIEAAVRRARPVALTALAAMLAFIPLTLDTFWGPLAYVLIGGVAVGTVLTILVVPALYSLWFRLGQAQEVTSKLSV